MEVTMKKKPQSLILITIMAITTIIISSLLPTQTAAQISDTPSPAPSPSNSDDDQFHFDHFSYVPLHTSRKVADKKSASSSSLSPSSDDDSDDDKDDKEPKDKNAVAAEIKQLCASMENPSRCEEFLGNSPNADPAHLVKSNLRVLKSLVEEGTYIASKDELKNPSTPDQMKKSLDTCVQNYDKAIASMDAAKEACKACDKDEDTSKDKKCSPEHVSKLNSMLSAAVSNFGACEEALNDAGSPPKPWIKELNDAMVEGTNILLEVAKKIQ